MLSLESLQIRRNHNSLKSLSFFFSPALRYPIVEAGVLDFQGVLIGQNLQAKRFGHIESAILRLPFVECRTSDPLLAANIPSLQSGFVIPQDRNDPLFRNLDYLISVSFNVTDSTHFSRIVGLRSKSTSAGNGRAAAFSLDGGC